MPRMRVAEVPAGGAWAIVAVDPSDLWTASDLEGYLHETGISTAAVDIDPQMPIEGAARLLHAAGAALKADLAGDPAVHFTGVGRGATAAMLAASTDQVASLLWRPSWQPGHPVVPATAPSMIVLGADQGRRSRQRYRRLVHRSGADARVVVLWRESDALTHVADWAAALSHGRWIETAQVPAGAAPRRSSLRRLAIPGAVALGAGTMMLPAAAGASPALSSSGRTVAVTQRAGDSVKLTAGTSKAGKKSRFAGTRVGLSQRSGDVHSAATGSEALIDSAGMKWFVNTDITFSTSSSASGAMSEASFQHAVAATTLNGGTTQSTLNDAYDGYNSLCISTNGATGTCETGNASWTIYQKNGVLSGNECSARQLDFPVQTVGNLQMSRKIYVPSDDHFARWLDVVKNTGASAQQVVIATGNNLGSDSNTVITGSSSGDKTASTADNWVTTFQNYSGTTSSDPRLGHVIAGPNAAVTPSAVSFTNGDDNPYWDYTVTIQPGHTAEILNFGVADGSIAASEADSARLDALPPTALECLSASDAANIVNFAVGTPGEAGATASTPDGTGYWTVTAAGVVTAHGTAHKYGDASGVKLAAPVVGIVGTPTGKGYWLVGADGGVFNYGDAGFHGSAARVHLAQPVVAIAATHDGNGYWLAGGDGGVFNYGDAAFHGSAARVHLVAPVVDIEPTSDSGGYWMAGGDGGVFNYGDAAFHGSIAGRHLAAPMIGLARTSDGGGYWLFGHDGGVANLGDAEFYGSGTSSTVPTIGAIVFVDGTGYQLIHSDGSSTAYGH
jgi:hypothetical protein